MSTLAHNASGDISSMTSTAAQVAVLQTLIVSFARTKIRAQPVNGDFILMLLTVVQGLQYLAIKTVTRDTVII